MEITQQQADERLKSTANLANRFSVIEIPIQRRGKKEGSKNLTPSVREEIAVRSRTGESQKSLANEFKTTQANVSNIEIGKTKVDEPKVSSSVQAIQDKALERLMESLGLLDQDKMSGCNAKDLSVISANLAKVIQQTTPKEESKTNGTTVIIYAPEQRAEHTFKTVQI